MTEICDHDISYTYTKRLKFHMQFYVQKSSVRYARSQTEKPFRLISTDFLVFLSLAMFASLRSVHTGRKNINIP